MNPRRPIHAWMHAVVHERGDAVDDVVGVLALHVSVDRQRPAVDLLGLKPQIGHNIGFQAPISTQSARAPSRA